MMRFLAGHGIDKAIAAVTFESLCLGDGRGNPPLYAGSARAVWRVEGDGRPAPYVNVFDWGGDVFGVPHLRIWYVQQGNQDPVGLGAFRAESDDAMPEREELQVRLAKALAAPGCYLVGDQT